MHALYLKHRLPGERPIDFIVRRLRATLEAAREADAREGHDAPAT